MRLSNIGRGRYGKTLAGYLLLHLFTCLLPVVAQQNAPKQIFVMDLRSEIDARTSRYVDLALQQADEIKADLIIIDMDTYGGALYDADDIRTRVLNYEKPVYVFINKDAASAGALISIACDSIYMAPGASIGAATVVTGGTGEAAPDKYQSYMRSIMRSTAEATGRNPQIAEAMVDENLAVDSISPAGKVITFSTSEAIKYGYCTARVNSIEEILERNQISDYQITHFELSTAEKAIALFINPYVSGILILIMLGGIYFELQTPGVGFPILAAFIALILYLTPYYLNGLAANWEIAAFFVGFALLALEIFVIPGFGVAGISGIILIVGSLVLIMLNNQSFDFFFVNSQTLVQAVLTALLGALGGIVLMFVGSARFANSKAFNRIALQNRQDSSAGYVSKQREDSMMGKEGVSFTVLRPSGKIMIEDKLYDAYTRGDYISKDEKIVVVSEEGSSLRVKLVKDIATEGLA